MFSRRHRHGKQIPPPHVMPGPEQHSDGTIFPLPMARIGQQCEIVDIHGRQDIRRHLTDLGFTPGTIITIATGHGGGIIVRMRETRIMLGRGMAHHILVKAAI